MIISRGRLFQGGYRHQIQFRPRQGLILCYGTTMEKGILLHASSCEQESQMKYNAGLLARLETYQLAKYYTEEDEDSQNREESGSG